MRHFPNWLAAYLAYAGHTEAPKHMHLWSGVSAVAGALRRRVWLDMAYFKWYPNFYIILVAPPGIVSKSTTAGIAMDLLRAVPGIKFGPDVVTWPALVKAFAEANEQFAVDDLYHTMCAMTLESSELGNLLNPQDREMLDLLVSLWDGKQGGFKKVTKTAGNDLVENPWINLIACTTPSWIAGNFPEYVIGGGFTSRCVFIYADQKERLIAYPHLHVPAGLPDLRQHLIDDLEHIAGQLVGGYRLTPEAIEWGEAWYLETQTNRPAHLSDERFGGYLARKQTHVHKLAMVLAAAQRDELCILPADLSSASEIVTSLEHNMVKVFSKIGQKDTAGHAQRFVAYIRARKEVLFEEAYRYVHPYFPDANAFTQMVEGTIRSGQLRLEMREGKSYLVICDRV